ncbi:MAG: FkbM family methyltransferase, partial [Synechococcaceae cyanobacterium SM2_3_1]|nr:FkbM family methyltransferase [Synechococcaceae cyanobacterium SM2_3_1]
MSYTLLKNIGLDPCITWTVEDYIQVGVELGSDKNRIQQLKQQVADSRRFSILWHSCEFARQLEAAFLHMAAAKPADQFQFLAINQQASTAEWNQLGFNTIVAMDLSDSALVKRRGWERAQSYWRQGLSLDPIHIGCWLNYLHSHYVLGDRERAFGEALHLFNYLLSVNPETYSCDVETTLTHLSWPEQPDHPGQGSNHDQILYCVVRWIAQYGGVIYRPEILRFWKLALDLHDRDIEARMIVSLNYLAEGYPEGLVYLRQVPTETASYTRAAIAEQIFSNQIDLYSSTAPPIYSTDYCGYKLAVEPNLHSITTLVLLAQGEWFEDEIQFFHQFLKPDMNVIDVGANIGIYSLLCASLVTDTGRVFAVEPTPSCVNLLESTLSLNPGLDRILKIYPNAAADQAGSAYLELHTSSVFNRILNKSEIETNSTESTLREVEIITLDQLWLSEGSLPIHLLKIDAEGAEIQVLKGAKKLIQNCHPVILFENLHGALDTGSKSACYLEEFDYSFYAYLPLISGLKRVSPQQMKTLNTIALSQKTLDQMQASIT